MSPQQAGRAWKWWPDRRSREERLIWTVLIAMIVVILICVHFNPADTPLNSLLVPLLLGSVLVQPRRMVPFVALILVAYGVGLLLQPEITSRILNGVGISMLLCAIVVFGAMRRLNLGVAGFRGESMLVDLRDRIQAQGQIPELPPEWAVTAVVRSASGTSFAGDFVVATRGLRCSQLRLAMVDVSGKGNAAGTRALLLSGALGGLISALDEEDFLPAANEYVLRQNWGEGFASAVQLSLDLQTGQYRVRSAGHPPVAQLKAGSGRWILGQASGALLGLLSDETYDADRGVLQPGDLMLIYSDGLVEGIGNDLDRGIDRLLGLAEVHLRQDPVTGAQRLLDATGLRDDDRTLVVVHRRGQR